MIAQATINKVEQAADVVDVIASFIKLQKKGINHVGCCPFHNENTPSFVVSGPKGYYKCFGCGEWGSAVNFIMKHENKGYAEAIEYLAGKYNITVEYDQYYDPKTLAEKKDLERQRMDMLLFTRDWYHDKLMNAPRDCDAWQELYKRGYDEDVVTDRKLGWAPKESRNVVQHIIERGWYQPAIDLGIIGNKNSFNYDIIQNRLTYPIEDINGVITGFGARYLGDYKKDDWPKWINSKESEWYQKKATVYNLNRARRFIRQYGYLYQVEGYNDVISMDRKGVPNTIAPCGTALTEEQVKLIKKQFGNTPHIVIINDGDEAGQKAAAKAVDMYLKFDFRTEVVEMPEGQDPDSYSREFANPEIEIAA